MTPLAPLISAADLLALLAQPGTPPLLLDTSFDLADTEAGRRQHAEGHVPGALYVHLDQALCGAKTGLNGRHPLPAREAFAATASAWGLTPARRVVVMDRQGAMFAARLWWMLRDLGHDAVQVLDGGVAAWAAAGGSLETGEVAAPTAAAPYPLSPSALPRISAEALQQRLPRVTLIDARAPERYRGDLEPLDAQAGHIPGARNRFFKDNLQADGRFKPAAQLRAEFDVLLGALAAAPEVVHQCGSGVTACHNLLAASVAGRALGTLYPGSWSEWSADPSRPVAKG